MKSLALLYSVYVRACGAAVLTGPFPPPQETTFDITADMTRQYKAMQEELLGKINVLQNTINSLKDDLGALRPPVCVCVVLGGCLSDCSGLHRLASLTRKYMYRIVVDGKFMLYEWALCQSLCRHSMNDSSPAFPSSCPRS